MFVWWLLDKWVASRRYTRALPVRIARLSPSYIFVMLDHKWEEQTQGGGAGGAPELARMTSLFWLRERGSSARPHPFTSMGNRLGLQFEMGDTLESEMAEGSGGVLLEMGTTHNPLYTAANQEMVVAAGRLDGLVDEDEQGLDADLAATCLHQHSFVGSLRRLRSVRTLPATAEGPARASTAHTRTASFSTAFVVCVSARPGSFTGALADKCDKAVPEVDASRPSKIDELAQEMELETCCQLDVRGPEASCYDRAISEAAAGAPVCVIASGSGAALALDFLQWAVHSKNTFQIHSKVLYTTRDEGLFHFVVDVVTSILEKDTHRSPKLEIVLSLTGQKKAAGLDGIAHDADPRLKIRHSRLNFEHTLANTDHRTSAFFCGAPLLKRILADFCHEEGIPLTAGHLFDQPSPKEIEDMALNWFEEGHDESNITAEVRSLAVLHMVKVGQEQKNHSEAHAASARRLRRMSTATAGSFRQSNLTRARGPTRSLSGLLSSASTTSPRRRGAEGREPRKLPRAESKSIMYDF
jgi:hypothetical protein